MENSKLNLKLLLSCLLVFIVALFLRLHFINLKQGFHFDETLSINISNINEYGWLNDIPKNKAYTGKYLKHMILFNDASSADTINDIKQLHKNNNSDTPHTNLYYTALRAWFNGFDSIDMKDIIWRGLSLNLVFFSLSFLIMYKILRRLFNDNVLIPFGLLVAFVNTGTISNTLFLRPYQLQETIFLLLTYVSINFYYQIKSNSLISKKNFFIASFVLALTLLSGYMSILFIAFMGLGLILASIQEKQTKNISFLVGALLTSIFFAWLGYFGYFNGFTSNRAIDAVHIFNTNHFIKNLKHSLIGYFPSILYFIYYIPTLLLVLFLYIKKRKWQIKFQNNSIVKFIITISILWTMLVMFLVPFKVVRYIEPVFPLLALLYPYILVGFKSAERYIYTAILSSLFFIYAITPKPTESLDTNLEKTYSYLQIPAKIENLFLTTLPAQNALKNANVPVVIDYDLLMLHLIPFLQDEQLYAFIDSTQFSTNVYELYIIEPKNRILYSDSMEILEKYNWGWGTKMIKFQTKNR